MKNLSSFLEAQQSTITWKDLYNVYIMFKKSKSSPIEVDTSDPNSIASVIGGILRIADASHDVTVKKDLGSTTKFVFYLDKDFIYTCKATSTLVVKGMRSVRETRISIDDLEKVIIEYLRYIVDENKIEDYDVDKLKGLLNFQEIKQ